VFKLVAVFFRIHFSKHAILLGFGSKLLKFNGCLDRRPCLKGTPYSVANAIYSTSASAKFTGYEFGSAELAENTSVAEPLQLFQCQKLKFPATSSI